MRTRWIIIGTVRPDTQLYGWGAQGKGWWINWRGRETWCQPSEFKEFDGVKWAVEIRLKLARLELVALASRPPRQEYQQLWALVRRKKKHGNV